MIADLVDLSILLLLAVLIGYPATLTVLQAVQARARRSQQRQDRY